MTGAVELTAGANLVTFEVKRDDLSGFTMNELSSARDAMCVIGDVLAGLLCQPRYVTHPRRTLNAAGDVLDLVQTLVARISDAIEDESASRVEGLSAADATTRAFLLMKAIADRQDTETPGPSVRHLANIVERSAA